MELICTPCDTTSNSYVSLEEIDDYIKNGDGFNTEEWNNLEESQKILRMVFGAFIIDSLNYRGRKACKWQYLKFPRIMPATILYDSGSSFEDYESLSDFAALVDEPVPEIPQSVKFAQCEAAYQIVHSHLFNIEAFESGESSIANLKIDVISMTFEKQPKSPFELFAKADFGAASTIKLLLQPFLSNIRAAIV